MTSFILDVVSIAGRALEREDRELGAIFNNRHRHGGILRVELERYYQFVFLEIYS
jgi:hypothetical protein